MITYLFLNRNGYEKPREYPFDFSPLYENFKKLTFQDYASITIFNPEHKSQDDLIPKLHLNIDNNAIFTQEGFCYVMYQKCSGFASQNGMSFFYCTRFMMHCPASQTIIDSHINLETSEIAEFVQHKLPQIDNYLQQNGVDLTGRKIMIMPGFLPSPGQDTCESAPGTLLYDALKKTKHYKSEAIVLLKHEIANCKLNLESGQYEYEQLFDESSLFVLENVSSMLPISQNQKDSEKLIADLSLYLSEESEEDVDCVESEAIESAETFTQIWESQYESIFEMSDEKYEMESGVETMKFNGTTFSF